MNNIVALLWQYFTLGWTMLRMHVSVAASCQLSLSTGLQLSGHVGFYKGRQPLPHFTRVPRKCHSRLISLAINLLAEEIMKTVHDKMRQCSLHLFTSRCCLQMLSLLWRQGHPDSCTIRSKSFSYLNSFNLSMILPEILCCRGTPESDQSPWFSAGWPQIKVTEENRSGSGFWRSRLVVGHWSEFGGKSQAHSHWVFFDRAVTLHGKPHLNFNYPPVVELNLMFLSAISTQCCSGYVRWYLTSFPLFLACRLSGTSVGGWVKYFGRRGIMEVQQAWICKIKAWKKVVRSFLAAHIFLGLTASFALCKGQIASLEDYSFVLTAGYDWMAAVAKLNESLGQKPLSYFFRVQTLVLQNSTSVLFYVCVTVFLYFEFRSV